jgi:hypothetical protein
VPALWIWSARGQLRGDSGCGIGFGASMGWHLECPRDQFLVPWGIFLVEVESENSMSLQRENFPLLREG